MDVASYLDAPVTEVAGVTPRLAGALQTSFGIGTVSDLLEHFPHQDKYRDIGAAIALDLAVVGEPVTVIGHIAMWSVLRPRGRKLTIAKAKVRDDTGAVVEAAFFNQDWRVKAQPEGTRVAVSGTLERYGRSMQLKNAKLTALDDEEGAEDLDRVRATYPATEKIPTARLAALVTAALEQLPGPLPDPVPLPLRRSRGLIDLDTAMRAIHRPSEIDMVGPARDRLVYDELLSLQIGLQQRRHRLEADAVGIAQAPEPGGLAGHFWNRLPFPPTRVQTRAIGELGRDLARAKPMHRLLQGDVGAGKTLVAAWTALCALDHARQAALMVPTEVLAEQHQRSLSQLLAPIGVNAAGGPRMAVLTGATTGTQVRTVLAGLAVGDVHLVIGTHALLEDRVRFADLGVVVIDEQHRFGVEHRARLRDKRTDGRTPDVLVMTATPIPRSLALTLYGDLDVTVLDELPPGREPIRTQVLPSDSPRRQRLWEHVRALATQVEKEQTYVVCPLVEDSDALGDVASAIAVHADLSTRVFPELTVGLVHGRLSSAEKDAVMEGWRRRRIDVLVATTVIEVGIDNPHATVMVIEDADRFGISQLHQLRGRIGRGAEHPVNHCVLFSSSPEGNARLEAVASTTDGFELAELDLQLRGEGSLFDTRQSGLPDLKLARLARDTAWVAATREDARALVEADPELTEHPALLAEARRRYGEDRLAALKTG